MTLINADSDVVAGFGDEWTRFDQSSLSDAEINSLAEAYFGIFPFDSLPPGAVGVDVGCGSGRWARYVAPRVGELHCLDAGEAALDVARRNLVGRSNVHFHHASVSRLPFPDDSLDFGYCLGVLHHVPDTEDGLRRCIAALKPGAPFLLYLYYAFDNRPTWYRHVWHATEGVRYLVSRLPHSLRYAVSQMIAVVVYWPLARLAALAERNGVDVERFPLSIYRHRPFYVMRTDALDRFGTRLERRFSRDDMHALMVRAGLRDIRFSDSAPYWCAVGFKDAPGVP
jgi:ubiquinone/menaquinone biosynthesis C-methylase UbiE